MESELGYALAHAKIVVTSETTLAVEIMNLLGVSGGEVWMKGDLISSRTALRHRYHGWRLRSRLERSAELADHVSDVLTQLAPYAERFDQLDRSCDVEMSCLLELYGEARPPLFLSAEIVAGLRAIRASIGIDLYQFQDDRSGRSPPTG